MRRLKRIGARAVPELTEAFAAGRVTFRQYDIISRCRAAEQRTKIGRLNQEIESARLAAETIDALLDSAQSSGSPVRLTEIATAISGAIEAARVP